jgi:hypothetical protein
MDGPGGKPEDLLLQFAQDRQVRIVGHWMCAGLIGLTLGQRIANSE